MATTISVSDAAKLREHPKELLVEYIDNFQSRTGEYVCPICGEFFTKEERKELDAKRELLSSKE